ncbi:DNA/RNA polymerase [Auriscalpium vulgare]|uniref:DNA/RNA polymerase n=1 Tax=Auriscalpium vulgare TaxID=40419 RepID=A0ACB8S282_9AGAM|nr:DNA/RNA polymerase [Auriscalpium vulgare]
MSSNHPPEPSQETTSLLHRLAGPSTTKAGLAKDQTEINRIIADASKGSKFYENEKRKDKDLTQRIERILRQRDDAVKGVDLGKIEAKMDHLLSELEIERDLTQYIVHVDMDAFYANVELLDNPDLAGKAFGVGRGVLSTASYEARKYGVRSGMPEYIAKKLYPDLVIVPIHMSRYSELSKTIMIIFREYDPNMLSASVDEAYMNITQYCQDHGLDPDECVQTMRQRVVDETKLTVSAGLAANKMLAKVSSCCNKPNGQYHLPHDRDAIVDFMRELSIRKIPGVGRVNERLLESIGIKTCGDIYTHRAVLCLMDKQFGLHFMLRTHLGIASNVVQPWLREERKSIGAETTFHAISEKTKILEKLEGVAEELAADMESSGWVGKTITLKFKLDTYQVFTRAKSFDRWITTKEELFATGKDLLQPEWPLRLRLIGLRLTKLKDMRKKDDGQGIKRFFESVGGSPSKRHKKEHHREEDADYDDVMPGYHEHQYDAEHPDDEPDIWEVDPEYTEYVASTSKAPLSTGPRPSSSARPSSSSKPISAPARVTVGDWQDQISSASSRPPASVTSSTTAPAGFPCPLCTRPFADNDELNAHVDWCLSREAIRAAQAGASDDTASNRGKGKEGTKGTPGGDVRAKEASNDGRKEWWKAGGGDRKCQEKGKNRRKR